jgi:exodeoxyribonuclease III
MLIATFNCNSIRSRMDVVLRWLEENRPDALCLQETKVQDAEFPAEPIEKAGWHVAFRGEKAYNGVALISKEAAADVQFGLDDAPRDEARLLSARLGRITVVNTYVPQGREVEHPMYRYFDRRFTTSDLVLWAGDLNVAAEPVDVHNPAERGNHVCYHADARKAFAECRARGFVDVFRKHHPEPGQYTFFDYRTPKAAERRLGWRIDYLLASPALAERSVDARIDLKPRLAKKSSDHTFLAAEFEV